MKKIILSFSLLYVGISILQAQDKTAGLKFDGVDDYVLIPHSSVLNLGRSAFTIEAWIKADTGNYNTLAPMVLSKKGAGSPSTDGFLFGMKDNGQMALQLKGVSFSGGGGGGGTGVSPIDLRDNQCHHIAWTREVGGVEDTINAYQDAAYVKKSRLPAGLLDITNTKDLWIGWSDFNKVAKVYQFSGMIKEIRIWNFAKTEQQIFADRNKHMVGNETGLIAYWRLSENWGDTAYDCTSNANHGTLQNGVAYATFCDILDTFPSSCVPDTSGPVDTNTAVLTYGATPSVRIFPNPTTGIVILYFEDHIDAADLVVTNIQGQQMQYLKLRGTGQKEIDITGPSGMYFLEVRTPRGKSVYRVVKE